MRPEKEKAIKLRLSGKSYSEISKALNVPKSTLSVWLSKIILSDRARENIFERTNKKAIDLLIQRNRKQTVEAVQKAKEIRDKASLEVGELTKDRLFNTGICLYWAEGYKRVKKTKDGRELNNHPVSMTNTDPHMIKIFVRFLKEICDVPIERVKANLRLFKYMNEELAIKYWSDTTGISIDNFGKTYYGVSKSSLGKKPFNRLPYGIIQVRVYDTNLFHKIIGWITGLKSQC